MKKIIWVMLIITIMMTVSCTNNDESGASKVTSSEKGIGFTPIEDDTVFLSINSTMSEEEISEIVGKNPISITGRYVPFYVLSDGVSRIYIYGNYYVKDEGKGLIYVLFNPDTDKEEKITLEEYLDRKK